MADRTGLFLILSLGYLYSCRIFPTTEKNPASNVMLQNYIGPYFTMAMVSAEGLVEHY